jgi:dUTPase
MGIVDESEYKGNKMIVLKNSEDDKFPFQFGLKKAKLVVEHIEDIKKFVEKYDKPKEK